MRNILTSVQTKNPGANPSEGIFYVVRLPNAWEPMTLRFEGGADVGHPDFWRHKLVPLLARAWSPLLGLSARELESNLSLCEYGFPRGRVVRQGNTFRVFHGNDLRKFMNITRVSIEGQFGIIGAARWQEDEHEQCLKEDKQAVQALLRLREDWKHADIGEHT